MKFIEASRQIENGRADPRLLDEHLMYGERHFQDILSQIRSLDEATQWKLGLRSEELMTSYTFDRLIETHLERIAKARNGSYGNEKAVYCLDNAESYKKLAGVYSSDRRKANEMKKLARSWSKMATACLAMPN